MQDLLYDCFQDVKRTIKKRIEWLEAHKNEKSVECVLGKLMYWKGDIDQLDYLGWEIIIPFEHSAKMISEIGMIARFGSTKIKVNPNSLKKKFQGLIQILEEFYNKSKSNFKIILSTSLSIEKRGIEQILKVKSSKDTIIKNIQKKSQNVNELDRYMTKINDEVNNLIKGKTTCPKSKIVKLILDECYENVKGKRIYNNFSFFSEEVFKRLDYGKNWNLKSFKSLMNSLRMVK